MTTETQCKQIAAHLKGANDIRAALRLLERLANPRGDWRDDEARRKARNLLKRLKRHENSHKDNA